MYYNFVLANMYLRTYASNMNLRLKKVKRESRRNMTFRISEKEYNAVLRKASVHTNGNVSEWVRYAAQNFTPRKADLESED